MGGTGAGVGVGRSLGLGAAIARGAGDSSSAVARFAGVGFGVLSGSASALAFFFPNDFFLPDLALVPFFFFLPFGVAEGLLDFLADGVERRVPPSLSSSLDFGFVVAEGDFFGSAVGDSSSLSSDFDGVFFAAGVGLFFFLGEGLGVTDGDARCFGRGVSLGKSSSLTCPCNSDATSAKIAREVAMQRRRRATFSAP